MDKLLVLLLLLLVGLGLLVWLSMVQYRVIRQLLKEDIRQFIKEEMNK